MIAFESGIDEHDLKRSILPRLEPKIIYVDGWIYIKNFEKYHANRSQLTKKGIEIAWDKVPKEIRLKIKEYDKNSIPHTRGIQGVSPSALALASALSPTDSTPHAQKLSMEEEIKKTPFNDFKKAYPRKTRMKDAEKIWNRLSLEIQQTIIKDIPIRIKGRQWKEDNGKYILYPTTYLNGERWNDEIEAVEIKNKVIHVHE
jgi:hypothetical protein